MRAPTVTVRTLTLLSGVDDAQLEAALQLRDRALRHEQRVRADRGLRADAAVLPGRRTLPGFGKSALMRIVPVFGSISRSTARTAPRRG